MVPNWLSDFVLDAAAAMELVAGVRVVHMFNAVAKSLDVQPCTTSNCAKLSSWASATNSEPTACTRTVVSGSLETGARSRNLYRCFA